MLPICNIEKVQETTCDFLNDWIFNNNQSGTYSSGSHTNIVLIGNKLLYLWNIWCILSKYQSKEYTF